MLTGKKSGGNSVAGANLSSPDHGNNMLIWLNDMFDVFVFVEAGLVCTLDIGGYKDIRTAS